MAAPAQRYACQECGAVNAKWAGRCDACGAWNSIVEEVPREPRGLGRGGGRRLELVALRGDEPEAARTATGIAEFDRAIGGGLVRGSALLISGDPGIGKSTLVLQAAAALAKKGTACLYVSGEEAIEQVRLRARRLGLSDAAVMLASATSVRDILASLDGPGGAEVVVIDSIQTMFVDSLDSAPGTVAQVRTSAHELIRFAKRRGTVLLVVGHVTKEGQIAGPRVLEHMVDTVLYFEGERSHQFRILRAVKNRFGAPAEIGVVEMTSAELYYGAENKARRSTHSVGAVPRRARPLRAGRRGVRRPRGEPTGARRDPGAGGAVAAGDPAPRRRRLGLGSARHGDGGARRAVRARPRRQ